MSEMSLENRKLMECDISLCFLVGVSVLVTSIYHLWAKTIYNTQKKISFLILHLSKTQSIKRKRQQLHWKLNKKLEPMSSDSRTLVKGVHNSSHWTQAHNYSMHTPNKKKTTLSHDWLHQVAPSALPAIHLAAFALCKEQRKVGFLSNTFCQGPSTSVPEHRHINYACNDDDIVHGCTTNLPKEGAYGTTTLPFGTSTVCRTVTLLAARLWCALRNFKRLSRARGLRVKKSLRAWTLFSTKKFLRTSRRSFAQSFPATNLRAKRCLKRVCVCVCVVSMCR